MNVYSFKTLETLFYVGAENLTDAVTTAEAHLKEVFAENQRRAEFNGIGNVELVAGNIIIAGAK